MSFPYRQICPASAVCTRTVQSTVRYLGIEVDDALAIAEQVDVRINRAEQIAPPAPFRAELRRQQMFDYERRIADFDACSVSTRPLGGRVPESGPDVDRSDRSAHAHSASLIKRARLTRWPLRVIFDVPHLCRTGPVYLNNRKCGAHSDTSESRHLRTFTRCFIVARAALQLLSILPVPYSRPGHGGRRQRCSLRHRREDG